MGRELLNRNVTHFCLRGKAIFSSVRIVPSVWAFSISPHWANRRYLFGIVTQRNDNVKVEIQYLHFISSADVCIMHAFRFHPTISIHDFVLVCKYKVDNSILVVLTNAISFVEWPEGEEGFPFMKLPNQKTDYLFC